ncbi:MAG TPA: hypothetical protein VFU31_04980 [Candidatus Binatia bacterium]|nr:hypothetical protein [Candidatus Binatia bacterium]
MAITAPILLTESQQIAEPDYSSYSLPQLLEARQWIEARQYPDRENRLELEIRKRCDHFREVADSNSACYRSYGLKLGAPVLGLSIAPMVVGELLDMMGIINPDNDLLWGLWALLTLPIAVTVFIIAGVTDAERVVKWFDL